MARATGTWLSGLGAAGAGSGEPGEPPGVRLGLPAAGRGAVAGFGARAGAFAVDALLSGLVARLFFPVRDLDTPQASTTLAPLVAFALLYVVGLALTGQTPGMRLLRLRVVPVRSGARAGGTGPGSAGGPLPGLVPTALRTALLMLLVPALISDRDGRGLHDRASGTVVVRA